ncbi:hypothetical protein CEXT_352261 [Caerostris extrusa]|uniref:Uncharacterized protein n=1 Tax=Caerostris extrusa TaxID=172846 RepID=A0AAV4V4X1_CAEEX|nr:hypothetical protein CEXT_352261 [Caerostris extrusa]
MLLSVFSSFFITVVLILNNTSKVCGQSSDICDWVGSGLQGVTRGVQPLYLRLRPNRRQLDGRQALLGGREEALPPLQSRRWQARGPPQVLHLEEGAGSPLRGGGSAPGYPEEGHHRVQLRFGASEEPRGRHGR